MRALFTLGFWWWQQSTLRPRGWRQAHWCSMYELFSWPASVPPLLCPLHFYIQGIILLCSGYCQAPYSLPSLQLVLLNFHLTGTETFLSHFRNWHSQEWGQRFFYYVQYLKKKITSLDPNVLHLQRSTINSGDHSYKYLLRAFLKIRHWSRTITDSWAIIFPQS